MRVADVMHQYPDANIKIPTHLCRSRIDMIYSSGYDEKILETCQHPGSNLFLFLMADLTDYANDFSSFHDVFRFKYPLILDNSQLETDEYIHELKDQAEQMIDELNNIAAPHLERLPQYVTFLIAANIQKIRDEEYTACMMSGFPEDEIRYWKRIATETLKAYTRVFYLHNKFNSVKEYLLGPKHILSDSVGTAVHWFQYFCSENQIAYTTPVIQYYTKATREISYSLEFHGDTFTRVPNYERTLQPPALLVELNDKNGKRELQNIVEMYYFRSLEDMLVFEFLLSIKLECRIINCKNCRRLFLTHKKNQLYCSNIAPNGNGVETCQDIASKPKPKTDKYILEYNKFHNRYAIYMARMRDKLENGKDCDIKQLDKLNRQYDDWKKMSRSELCKFREALISGEELIERTRPTYLHKQ